MKSKIAFTLIIVLFSILVLKAQNSFEKLTGAYLGQKLPDNKAEIFAPGLVSTGLYERDLAITKDGKEIYYSIFMGDWNTMMVTRQENGYWTEPVVAEFARDTNFFFAEPALSVDGNKIYYLSTKPRENEVAKQGWQNQNIWFAERNTEGNWGESKPLPENINAQEEFYPSLTNNGTLYFCRTDKETGSSQILRSKLIDGLYADPVLLPAPINEKGTHFNACIAPDDSYLIGCVVGRDSLNPRYSTYMLFFHNQDDTWSNGIDLVKELNLPCNNAISVSITPDGKYIFFASTKKSIYFNDLRPEWNLTKLMERRTKPGNGNSDIYWISAESINKLR
ncbi:MAG: hypothetical protein RBT49_12395 [Bacteroidales bacterium]|jgi:hypothetical protein|nr:hypothetical protein [Bacteroidales bacterium]